VHLLVRSPQAEEESLVRRVLEELDDLPRSGRLVLRASIGELRGSLGQGQSRAILLSGDLSGWCGLLERLDAAGPLATEVARSFETALFPRDPEVWRLRTRELSLRRPLVMGIVNVTPDSFSDGGLTADRDAAVERGRLLAEEGADILDVGGESTRPGSDRVSEEEERRRVIPVIAGLAGLGVPISVDTTRSAVAEEALAAGAEIVNDVSAFGFEPETARVAAAAGAGVVLMHMRGTPRTMQQNPVYQDVMGELLEFLGQALARAAEAGVDPERCAVDPGIGFGKRQVHNEEILYRLEELRGLGRPLLVGASRKGFLDPEKRRAPAERVPETIAAACLAAVGGAHILRVHDVGECSRALEIVGLIHGGH
jgi:dihydropteroate synthase